MSFWRQLARSIMLMVLLTLVLGIIYPFFVAGVGNLLFSREVNGSLVTNTEGVIIGSSLIGQNFNDPKYFWGRPTTALAYNPEPSMGANLGPTNPAFLQAFATRVKIIALANRDQSALIPIDLVTASASGLDPDISLAGAEYQALRVAKARKLALEQVESLIQALATPRQLGFLGEPRINVLQLNLALDQLSHRAMQSGKN